MKIATVSLVLFVFTGLAFAETVYVRIDDRPSASGDGEMAAKVATEWEKKNPDKVITCLSVQQYKTTMWGIWITYSSKERQIAQIPQTQSATSTNKVVADLKLPNGVQHFGEGVLYFQGVERTFATRLVQFISMNRGVEISAICPNIVLQNRLSDSQFKEIIPRSDYGAPDGYYVVVQNKK